MSVILQVAPCFVHKNKTLCEHKVQHGVWLISRWKRLNFLYLYFVYTELHFTYPVSGQLALDV